MIVYINCVACGCKLFKAELCQNMQIQCWKCKEKLVIDIKDGKLTVVKATKENRHVKGVVC